jgi:hypothetical protein
MEQHPIPQNVSSYQFKLVGDMTLKQFFQLAGGFVIALIFYASPLIGIVKWPFIIISAVLGVALAFVPLEERPLERWIFAFFKAIYTPTEFFWKKTAAPTKFFQDEAVGAPPTTTSTEQEAALKNYYASTKQNSGPLSKLEGAEQGFLAALGGIFSGAKSQPIATSAAAPAEEKKELKIPVTSPIRVVPQAPTHLVVEEKTQQVPQSVGATAQNVSPFIAGNEIVSTKQAIFSVDAAPPNPPEAPNIVVGQVVDDTRRIIEGAIMEIRDEAGRPVRALRSNKVGHFITVTPLDSGRYEIATEKEGYQFSPVSFEAAGALIPPILVEGKKVAVPEVVPVQPPVNPLSGQQIQSSYAVQ